MDTRYLFTSVTRISDLPDRDFEVGRLPRSEWDDADYVAGTVTGEPSSLYKIELANGRIVEAMEGMPVIGAFGRRAATLEATGDWRTIPDDGSMSALTGAGLFGKAESIAPWLPRIMTLSYDGHILRDGQKVTMTDFVEPVANADFAMPVILLIGTSMSAGKTTTGRVIIHALKRAGLRVAAAKLTGAGRYRDVLSFQDAGADAIVDFVDAGLPSTVVAKHRFERALKYMLARIGESRADVLVAEAGASPLEPYNGDSAIEALGDNIRCTVLCASDPYAVLGVQEAFKMTPDIVTGPAANTAAAIDLVRKLTGLDATNLLRNDSIPKLMQVLRQCLPDGLIAGP